MRTKGNSNSFLSRAATPGMELWDSNALARWFRADLRLEAAAEVVERDRVDGFVFLALLELDGGLSRIGVTDVLAEAHVVAAVCSWLMYWLPYVVAAIL